MRVPRKREFRTSRILLSEIDDYAGEHEGDDQEEGTEPPFEEDGYPVYNLSEDFILTYFEEENRPEPGYYVLDDDDKLARLEGRHFELTSPDGPVYSVIEGTEEEIDLEPVGYYFGGLMIMLVIMMVIIQLDQCLH